MSFTAMTGRWNQDKTMEEEKADLARWFRERSAGCSNP
jgi:hypothetical protein